MIRNVTPEELQLAARNHGMPLEGLRYDVTPAGMHYLLIHFDVPETRPDAWRLAVDGHVRSPLDLGLRDLQARETVTRRVTLECAGNGRARLAPRPLSQPWLLEAVGNAEWTGTPLAPLLEEAGLEDDVVDLVFTGADHGLQGDVEQDYQRSLSVEDAMHPDVMLVWEMNGQPLLPQHGAPLRLLVPGWYGMTSVKWLTRIEAVPDRFEGFQMLAYRKRDQADDEGIDVTRIFPRSLMIPPGFPEFFTRTRIVDAGRIELTGRAWSGWGRIVRVEVSTDGGTRLAGRDPRGATHADRMGSLEGGVGGRTGRVRVGRSCHGRCGERPAARTILEPSRVREQRGPAGAGHGSFRPLITPAERASRARRSNDRRRPRS